MGTVRSKTLFIILATLIIAFALAYLPLRLILLDSFLQLEQQQVSQDVQRVESALRGSIADLDRLAGNFSDWDDTYAYMTDPDPSYIAANYPEEMLLETRVELIMLVDRRGQTVYGRYFNQTTRTDVPPPARLASLRLADPLIRPTEHLSRTLGLLMLPDGPMLLVARPILTSTSSGTPQGTFLMGSYLDPARVSDLAQTTHLKVDVYRAEDRQMPDDVRSAQTDLLGAPLVVRPLGDEQVAGFTLVPDIFGAPGLIIRVEEPREIYARGLTSLRYFSIMLLVVVLLCGAVMIWLLERSVLARLSHLINRVSAIGAHSDPLERISLAGRDEFALLAQTINTTLDSLARAQQERRRAEAASIEAKNDFIATVSHELRTPLTPIVGYVDLLLLGEGGHISDNQQHFLHTIKGNALRMRLLIEDLLEIGRLDSGKLVLELAPVALDAAVNEVLMLLQVDIQRKGLRVELDLEPDLPRPQGDVKRLGQVITNLVSNALKYTPAPGTIWVRTRSTDTAVLIEVEDTGIGMTFEQQEQLFTRFYRADGPLRESVSGTGLGLSIARAFIELHGGTITVRSQPG
ncbi:MAG: hypothetical protein H7Y32_06800, partial [Chloroflexales bacterium]|nr:hypothetical protein [Chloroflexales bacterium]